VKRWLWPLFLVSLGLNLGFGLRLAAQADRGDSGNEPPWQEGRHGSGLADAMADSGTWNDRIEHRLTRLLDRLDLDEGTRRDFARVHRRNAAQVWAVGRDLHTARLDLRDAVLERREPQVVRSAVHRLTGAQSAFDSVVTETLLSELDALPADRQARYLGLLPWQRWGPPGRGGPAHREMRRDGTGRSAERRGARSDGD